MIEAKNLVKVYKPKKGVPVRALDGVSLKLPAKGMVFLLGKSGSGKSTLLNVLGGLDSYDEGEILIKGTSSKDFKQKHFDSYRNTYVGFIFQEYNVLEDFTVGANIALAIELQGRKATDAEINDILKEVDLEGYGSRKPNELSGGQKQRVAIARALIKNPEIIMADEPTGALDSNTGRQVFDTLKKLSSDKLVLIVSHDREFAEKYADRIIELADGKIISDVELTQESAQEEVEKQEENHLSYEGDSIKIADGYSLTEEDRIAINAYIKNLKNGATLKIGGTAQSAPVDSARAFVATDESKIAPSEGGFSLIKSRLSLKHSFRIGASGLKHKKFRLVMTILLSFIAFTLFGLADTAASYNEFKTSVNSVVSSDLDYAAFVKHEWSGSDDYQYWSSIDMTADDLNEITEKSGVKLKGVYSSLSATTSGIPSFTEYLSKYDFKGSETMLYTTGFTGVTEITPEELASYGYKLTGRLPDGDKNEIAITDYVYKTFEKCGFKGNDGEKIDITKHEDLIGKTFNFYSINSIWGELGGIGYTITGIIDTGLDFDRYKEALQGENLMDMVISNELYYARNFSLHNVIFVGKGYVDKVIAEYEAAHIGSPVSESARLVKPDDENENTHFMYRKFNYVAELNEVDKSKIVWLDGEKTNLAEGEIIITSSLAQEVLSEYHPLEDGELLQAYQDGKFDGLKLGSSNTDYYEPDEMKPIKIVGIYDLAGNYQYNLLIADSQTKASLVGDVPAGIYNFAVGALDSKDRATVEKCVKLGLDESGKTMFEFTNSITYQLSLIGDMLEILGNVFIFIGIGFAVFAALMLSNFIATSISFKRQEIGILRAIGSRSTDVFKIFFSESFIIAMINFVLSLIATLTVSLVLNNALKVSAGILVTVLSFGIRQVALLLAVSIGVAIVATFLPVWKIASKKPIDAIRKR